MLTALNDFGLRDDPHQCLFLGLFCSIRAHIAKRLSNSASVVVSLWFITMLQPLFSFSAKFRWPFFSPVAGLCFECRAGPHQSKIFNQCWLSTIIVTACVVWDYSCRYLCFALRGARRDSHIPQRCTYLSKQIWSPTLGVCSASEHWACVLMNACMWQSNAIFHPCR